MVLKEQPDLSDVPPEVRRLLAKCLEKDPKQRLRDIADFEMLIGAPVAAAIPAAPARWPWVAATLAGVAAAAAFAVLWLRQPAPDEARHIQFALEPPPGTQFNSGPTAMTPSPDGRYIVFGAGASRETSMLWLRPLDALTARPLPGTEGGTFTFWSPDSKSLAFSAGGKLKRIAIAGGPAVTLADSNGSPGHTDRNLEPGRRHSVRKQRRTAARLCVRRRIRARDQIRSGAERIRTRFPAVST
jgi:hypothetical protein